MASPNKDMKTGDYSQSFEGGVGGYEPFRMKAADHNNSPIEKNYGSPAQRGMANFGVGESEMPEKPTPNKFLPMHGGGGQWGKKLMEAMKAKRAGAAGVAGTADAAGGGGVDAAADPSAAVGGGGEAVGGGVANTMMDQAQAGAEGGGAEGGGGEVPVHGKESHQKFVDLKKKFGGFKKGGLMGMFGSNKSQGGPKDRGILGNVFGF